MYKLQIINALTNELLREKTYKKPDLILDLIETGLKGKECFLFDNDCKTYKGAYVSHTSNLEDETKVFKVLFQLELSDIQARVAVAN